MNIVTAWAQAFLVTLLVELVVAIPLLPSTETRLRRALAVGFGQLITHPTVWFILPTLAWPRLLYLAAAESWAIAGELAFYCFVFRNLRWSRALAASALANAASYCVGTWLQP